MALRGPRKEYHRAWRAVNRERVKENQRNWYVSNWGRARKSQHTWYEAHREQVAKASKAWRHAHPERTREASRAWHAANAERSNAHSRAWARANPEKVRLRVNRRRVRKRAAAGTFTLAEWNLLLALFSFRCAYCWRSFPRLETDHVVPLSRGGSDSIENILPACRSCNAKKGASIV